ncbi:MAG: SUMF1/EgtB/PvdO family nonheme iron enzyme [Paludibacteraceae bacterium]|nr:SUMF1/EgtB/PvdO family nonheme iron enzyme [Paludibacteraceae bacterium]
MRKLSVIIICLCLTLSAFAQNVTNVTARQAGNTVEVTYNLDKATTVSLLLSADGGQTYNLHPKSVTGDIGSVTAGNNKKAVWNLLADSTDWDIAQARFKVVAQKVAAQRTFTVSGVSFTMVRVDGGTFTMGCTSEQGSDCDSDESPAHQVTLSAYHIGQTEVTQGLWQAVMGTTVRQQRDKANGIWADSIRGEGDNYPMYYINLDECQDFVRKLNSLLSSQLGGAKFALPTEAQWEFAARGGNKSQHYKYAGSNYIDNVAWYFDNSGNATHPVAGKSPNELGLYDMSGNVYEWCQDWDNFYGSGALTNPTGAASGSYRVNRGGSWGSDAVNCRVSGRSSGATPSHRNYSLGLRLVLLQF